MKMNWKEFEVFCVIYLNKIYGNKFVKKGESDFIISDIFFIGNNLFYIEVKMLYF